MMNKKLLKTEVMLQLNGVKSSENILLQLSGVKYLKLKTL